jgi:ABC-2 type transport system permease protein
MLATYAGYWLAGAALLAVAMLASLLTDNLTVAFILGSLFYAALIFLTSRAPSPAVRSRDWPPHLSVVEQLRDPLSGVVTLNAVVYFVGIAAVALYLNTALLARRRWPTGPKAPHFAMHYVLRATALAAVVASLTLLARTSTDPMGRHFRAHPLALPRDRRAAEKLGPEAAGLVFIYAYFGREVPRSYLDARNGLVGMLREFEATAGEAIHSRIIETVKYSPAAREAGERYNISPYRIPVTEESGSGTNEIYLGRTGSPLLGARFVPCMRSSSRNRIWFWAKRKHGLIESDHAG